MHTMQMAETMTLGPSLSWGAPSLGEAFPGLAIEPIPGFDIDAADGMGSAALPVWLLSQTTRFQVRSHSLSSKDLGEAAMAELVTALLED
jgi:hypothetical protein